MNLSSQYHYCTLCWTEGAVVDAIRSGKRLKGIYNCASQGKSTGNLWDHAASAHNTVIRTRRSLPLDLRSDDENDERKRPREESDHDSSQDVTPKDKLAPGARFARSGGPLAASFPKKKEKHECKISSLWKDRSFRRGFYFTLCRLRSIFSVPLSLCRLAFLALQALQLQRCTT